LTIKTGSSTGPILTAKYARRVPARTPLSTTDAVIGVGTAALGVAAMAVDHLLGDDPGLEDPPAFVFSTALILVVAGTVFGLVVRRATTESAPLRALALAVLAVVSLTLAFLGLPFPLAGGAVALGLRGRAGGSRVAAAALVLGAAVLALVTVGYGIDAARKLS
jgi:hypothetical protein